MTEQEKRIGPDLTTHQAGAVDLEKTTVRSQPVRIEEPGQGPGIYDARDQAAEQDSVESAE